jgi:hypothetical protein
MNVSTGKRTVYHISPLRLWTVPAIFIIIALLMLALPYLEPGAPDSGNVVIYMGMFFLAFAAIMYLIMRYTRLELSADGVKVRQFGYKLETDWDNVAQLYDMPGGQGLILHRPMDSLGAQVFSAARNVGELFDEEQIQLIAERRFIPITPFAYWLKHGLRADLNRRAPALSSE